MTKRIDLHCHSDASNRAAEVVLNAIHCPECYSEPEEVYAQARRRGMDFVTITDHDTIEGVLTLSSRDDVLIGEELTCWFPEDRCKMHVLVFGIDRSQHEQLQKLADDIYRVAEFIEANRIAHSVAHPIYRQNDRLERWHLERLLLLFKGFEALNGAHSPLHREAFEPMLDKLSPVEIKRLSETHDLAPRWPEPWVKSRTGGSDDHGLLNIGRTWTEFPDDVKSVSDVLDCLRDGRCQAGGESGSSAKLAHTFYSVAVRYYTRHIMAPGATPNMATSLLQTMAGERRAPTKTQLAKMALKRKVSKLAKRVVAPFAKPQAVTDTNGVLKKLFLSSVGKRIYEHNELRAAIEKGLPPLGEHADMFKFASAINRDVSEGLAVAISKSVDDASFTGLFEAISGILAQQFVLLPYYFSVFHQNKERHLLRQITSQEKHIDASKLRIGLFTDTLDECNGVGRFLRDMATRAHRADHQLTIHTSTPSPKFDVLNRKNFLPLLSRPMPAYPDLLLNLPPVLEILEHADRQQFDAIHVSTPGPMGLCGWLVAKMLRVPMLATYHTDFPAYVDHLTRDHRIVNGTTAYMKWFYGQASAVFSRSHAYQFSLRDLGVSDEKLLTISPAVDTEKFSISHRDPRVWDAIGVTQPLRLMYCGRVSVEKNLPLLASAFRKLCETRNDAVLIVAGEGPYLAEMKQAMSDLPAYFLGFQNDRELGVLYASSDLFVFPSRTDTLGQVVLEAQASGLPVLVAPDGGPKEIIEDGVTGMIIPADDPARWCSTIDELLNDPQRRQRMSRAAAQRASKLSLERTFTDFWADHVQVVAPPTADARQNIPPAYNASSNSIRSGARSYY